MPINCMPTNEVRHEWTGGGKGRETGKGKGYTHSL